MQGLIKSREHMETTILQFIKDINKNLESQNDMLQNTTTENHDSIKDLRLQKQKLFTSICNDLSTAKKPKFYLISHLSYSNQLWKTSLQNALHQIVEGVTQHNEFCGEWKKQAEQNLQLTEDSFTMMPFHEVEDEINRLDGKIREIIEETADIMKESEQNTKSLESQVEQILEDVANIEPYQKEMREQIINHNNIISEIKRKKKLDDFQVRLDAQQLLQLQKEIEEMEKEITALEKN